MHTFLNIFGEKKKSIIRYHEHDSLLENQVDQELMDEQKKEAWAEFEKINSPVQSGIVKQWKVIVSAESVSARLRVCASACLRVCVCVCGEAGVRVRVAAAST